MMRYGTESEGETGGCEMIIAANQPNFLPWLGLFYKIYKCDKFIFVDDVQLSTCNGISGHRNYIKTSQGKQLIRVPIKRESKTLYNEVIIDYQLDWIKKLEKTLYLNYHKAAYYPEVIDWFMPILKAKYELLSDLNCKIILDICERMGIEAEFDYTSKYVIEGKKEELVVNLVEFFKGDVYYSGTGAANYLNEETFEARGMKLIFSDYESIQYKQVGPDFIKDLCVLDYLFNCGFKNPFVSL